MQAAGGLRAAAPKALPKRLKLLQDHVRKKLKRGVDRLPKDGPDPAAQFKHGWRLATAAVLERYPVITPDLHPFEDKYLLGRILEMQKRARPIPPSFFLSEKDRLGGITEPTFDDPIADRYVPAPRVTDADRTNDHKSLHRALQERLYFVVRRTEKSKNMQFPQVLATKPDVTLRQYAQHALKSVTVPASRPRFHVLSYSPSCHLEHVYPSAYQQQHDVYGVKIFFYRTMLISGDVTELRNCEDYMWARACELPQLLGHEYYTAIKPILLGNGPTIDTSDAEYNTH
ncbi:39S ribosomal protein L46, mitochondrial [Gracilariopsis chorda]|uniref:39S ribosomal protein L46, mitochondrial n=1 Tax=Gracilariopsis chorda TaxID=448386 RepID=A0A2V3IMW8_9FLOR|nr:39S ribosomal protein L46, mitochondrial [Gracilariopsis chorda]|eukprot:PXF43426.1 39S ribosomal protein L46, mitochondrial [Gracilariopsis chorda]